MPIKRSQLESQLYYRVAKVVFWTLPLILGFVSYWREGTAFTGWLVFNIITVAVGIIAYYLALKIVWRIFLYMAFGGLEDDVRKQKLAAAAAAQQQAQSALSQKNANAAGFVVFLFVLLTILYYVFFIWQPSGVTTKSSSGTTTQPGRTTTQPSGTSGGGRRGTSTCIPTGCGTWWNCSGYYYVGNAQQSVSGCFPRRASEYYSGWVGTCRQCP